MQFSAQRRDVVQALQTIIGVVERRQTMPILSNVLVKGQNNQITLTATDLEIELVTKAPAVINIPGEVAIPARKLLDISRGLPDSAEIEVKLSDKQVHIQSGRSRFVLATLPSTDWPHLDEVEDGENLSVEENTLKRLLDKTHFAMAHQDVRYYLNGLLLALHSSFIRCVATDGHRLALCETDVQLAVENPQQAIIPRKAITELVRLLGNSEAAIKLWLSDKHLRVQLANLNFTTKLIDGRFPDYERVIPADPAYRLTASRDAIRQALGRAAILSNEKYGGVRLSLDGQTLTLQAQNIEREQAEEEIEVDYNGSAIEIGFNVSYLMDALGAMNQETFSLSLSGPDSSGLLQGIGDDSSKYVIMPMRL